MDFEDFKIYHSEVILFCQCIEHDLKWIYSYMLEGDPDKTFNSLSKTTLGTLVCKLRKLDSSDEKRFISDSDYDFLMSITEKRNYWCHQNYIEIMYIDNFEYSQQYRDMCNKLKEDHDRLDIVSKNIENVRLEAIQIYKRQ